MDKNEFYQSAFYFLAGAVVSFAVSQLTLPRVTTENKVILSVKKHEKTDTINIKDKKEPVIKEENKTSMVQKLVSNAEENALTDKKLMDELIRQNIKHPKIVLAQAKHETGNYKSKVFKSHKNLFGLRGPNGYYKFNTWQESVTGYKNYIQYKYKGGDYFEFLNKIGYAEDPLYTKRLKTY